MGRYDGEDYAPRQPCEEGSHDQAFNGSCHRCGVRCSDVYDGCSEAEGERRALRKEVERLRRRLAKYEKPKGCGTTTRARKQGREPRA